MPTRRARRTGRDRRACKAHSPFERAVARAVRAIPPGMTLPYGEVALRAGKPGAARAVASALKRLDDLPGWRVARHDGSLAPQVAHLQAQLLRAEGWKPRRKKPSGRARGPRSSR